MKIAIVFLIFLNSVLSFQEWWENSKITELTSSNFYDYIGKDKYVIVEFYTKWCGVCKMMLKEYERFYENVEIERDNVIVARIEADANTDIEDIYEVKWYPKIIMFYPNSTQINSEFTSRRNFEELNNWLNTNSPLNNNNNKEDYNIITEIPETKNRMLNIDLYNQNDNLKNELHEMKEQLKNLNEKVEKIENNDKESNSLNDSNNHKLRKSKQLKTFDIIFIAAMIFVMISSVIIITRIYQKL